MRIERFGGLDQSDGELNGLIAKDLVRGGTNRLFAVVHVAGKQYKVTAGDTILTNKLPGLDLGDYIRIEKILLAAGENFSMIGKPLLSQDLVTVTATVVEQFKSKKVTVFKKKAKKGYKRKRGHRQLMTALRIEQVEVQM